jgi:hypothetical protein
VLFAASKPNRDVQYAGFRLGSRATWDGWGGGGKSGLNFRQFVSG